MSLRPIRTKEEMDLEASELNNAVARINAKVAEVHLVTANETLKQVSNQLSMRTVCIAQVAATLMSAADKLKGVSSVRGAVQIAREILAEAEGEPCTKTENSTQKTTPTQSPKATSEKSSITTTSDSSTSSNTSSNDRCPRCSGAKARPRLIYSGSEDAFLCCDEFHR